MSKFKEQYTVRFDIQREDGYWNISEEETVFVDVEHGVNEKRNHDKARENFLKENPKAKVTCVIYD